MNENALVDVLGVRLQPRCSRVFIRENLGNYPSFKDALRDRFGYLPVLNEIDLVLLSREGGLCAIEVKYFKVENGSFNRPFYDGIGQALSLTRYGFDAVALWHLFSGEIQQDRFDRYGAGAWTFIRNQSGLPLDFSYFKVTGELPNVEFVVMQYTGLNQGVELSSVDYSGFAMEFRHPNSFLSTNDARFIREQLALALGVHNDVVL